MRRIPCMLAALPLVALSVASLPAQQSTESKDKWDVAKNLGFDRTLDFQTSEGTWMSVDVSPDLVVLDANPLENIRNSERVGMVMKNGVLYNENLDEVWPRERRRGALRF